MTPPIEIDKFPLRTTRDYLIVLSRDMAEIGVRLNHVDDRLRTWELRLAGVSAVSGALFGGIIAVIVRMVS